jgi:hypothetical protein
MKAFKQNVSICIQTITECEDTYLSHSSHGETNSSADCIGAVLWALRPYLDAMEDKNILSLLGIEP